MESDIKRRIRTFLAEEILYEDPDRSTVKSDTPLLSILDSLALMRLVTFLEEDLGVDVDDADITTEHFNTIDDVERMVAAKVRRV